MGTGEVDVAADIFPDIEKVSAELGEEDPSKDQIRLLLDKEVLKVNKSLELYKYIRYFTVRDTEFEKTTSKKIIRKYK